MFIKKGVLFKLSKYSLNVQYLNFNIIHNGNGTNL